MQKNTPPGPQYRFPINMYIKATKDPLAFMQDMIRLHGNFVHYQLGSRHDYLINDPDSVQAVLVAPEEVMARSTPPPLKRMLGNGLLISQGDFHRRQRRLIQPAFARNRIAEMVPEMSACVQKTLLHWKDGSEIMISEEMKRLTMRIVAKSIFGVDLSAEGGQMAEAIDTMQGMMNKNELPVIGDLFRKFPTPSNLKFKKDLTYLNHRIQELIDERKSTDLDQPDFLSMLLRLQKTEEGSKTLNSQQIRDEAMTFFIAGHETVSHALSWTWHLLAQNPEVQEQLARECRDALGGEDPTEEKLLKLPFAKKVFAESMRLYPPVWVVGRRPVVDFTVGGYVLSKGSHVYLSPYLMHRDERYYPNPDAFDPSRWEPEAMSLRPRFSYFPFGGGSRLCIGESFAWTEALVILSHILRKWRIHPLRDHPVDIETCVTLRPKHGIRIQLEEKRKLSHAEV